MWTASQIPHIVRTAQAITCGIPEAKLRVVAPDVGGGFGSKLDTYAEESICLALARRLGRPIKWTEERSEGYLATIHGRDLYTDMEMAATRDGELKAVRVNVYCAVGAYHQIVTPGIQMLSAWLYGGLYDVEGYDFEYTNIYTHTTPTDAYRGAGPARGHLRGRADDGPAGAGAGHRPRRAAAQELHPGRPLPQLHDRQRPDG